MRRSSKKTWVAFALCALVLIGATPLWADSIWKDSNASPYSTQKAYKVGDIINIIILENSSAKNKSGSNTNVSDDLAAKLTHTIAKLAPIIGTDNSIGIQLANQYAGDGSTTRGSNVTARVAAWVTEVQPNGNLAIKGKHKVEVNDDLQEITITGTVRAKDISGANTIYSYQVANVDLAMKGTGSVSDVSTPGWFTRFFNWLF